ncbi:MAG: hypothetical protein IPM77_06925 [Crocinitomicaceae bacterium]|nr:hypothetical protein [Crocinitomicaceae bacterium]
MNLIYSLLIGLIIFSCSDKQSSVTEKTGQNQPQLPADTLIDVILSDTLSFAAPTEYTICDTSQTVSFLQTGTFHDAEFSPDYASKKWTGLFFGLHGYFLEPALVNFERVNDAILDDENDKTGWQVSTSNSEMCAALLSGIDLKSKKIESVTFSKNILMPGDSLSFEFNKTHYTLFASGISYPNSFDTETRIAENYSMFISAVKNNIQITELLFTHESFDENMSFIEFIGDIDDDGFPDLIINTTSHYNTSNPTLFLSSPAEKIIF